MSDKKEPTPEERDVDYIRGQNESLIFLRKNPRFLQGNQANIALIKELLDRESGTRGEWREENLTRIFLNHQSEFTLTDEVKEPQSEPQAQPQPEVAAEDRPEWADHVIDRFAIDSIPREQYRKWMKDPEFQAAVNGTLRSGQ